MANSETKEVGYVPRGAIFFDGIMMPRLVEHKTVQMIKDGEFKFRDDDVILISYPKSGIVHFVLVGRQKTKRCHDASSPVVPEVVCR